MKIQRRIQQMQFGETMDTQTLATITLTDAEIEQAYRERRRYYNMEDIKSKIDNMIEEYEGEPEEEKLKAILEDEEKIRDLAERFDNALDNNDSFMESFWKTAEYVIEEEMEE